MSEDRFPKQLFSQKWDKKPRRGRQRKTWGRVIDDLFVSLGLDKAEWLEDIERGESSLASYLACIDECISKRGCRKFEEGLDNKVKLDMYMYKKFGKRVEFKKYLHGVSDAGTRLLLKFRSGMRGLNDELGRHRGREGKSECTLCGAECESVVHVLWECTACSSSRASFTEKLQELLGDSYADFDFLSNVEKMSYVLGSEHWEKNFKSLLFLLKEHIVNVWEVRKQYGDDACPSHIESQSLVGDLGGVTGVDGQRSCKLDKRRKSVNVNVSSIHFGANSRVCACVCCCVCGSAHGSGCVVDGGSATAAM